MEREHGDLRAIRRASGERRASHARARSKGLHKDVINEDEVPNDLSISVSLVTETNSTTGTTPHGGPETPDQQRGNYVINRARRQASGGTSPGGVSPHSSSTTPTSAASPFSASASPSLFRRRLNNGTSTTSSSSSSSAPTSPANGATATSTMNSSGSETDDLIERVRRHSSVWSHELTTRWEDRFSCVIMDALQCPEGPALIIARYALDVVSSTSPLGHPPAAATTMATAALLFDNEPLPRRRSLSPSLSGRLLRAASENAPPRVLEVVSPYPNNDSQRPADENHIPGTARRGTLT